MSLQDEIKALKQRIAELEEQVEQEKEFPQDGHWYWYITSDAGIGMSSWEEFEYQKEQLSIGNIFRTREEAEFALEKIKVEAKLRKYSRPFKEGENNYYVELYLSDKALSIDLDEYFQSQGTFYFDSEKIALEAIDAAGDWHIKKYIFGVED